MGRKPHPDDVRFAEFMESVPEEFRNKGYWKVSREAIRVKGGGVTKSVVGYLPFEDEDYESLKGRVRSSFAESFGAAAYYAVPCTPDRKEVPGQGVVKIVISESEVPMVAADDDSGSIRDTMKEMKGMQREALEMKRLQMQKQMMETLLGGKDGNGKEEVGPVVESPSSDSFQQMMMMKMLLGEGGGKKDGDQGIVDTKIDLAMARMEAMLAKSQTQAPSQDPDMKLLVQKALLGGGQENTFQSMMTMMVSQQKDTERERREEDRKREEERREERRRQDDERKEEHLREERRIEGERQKREEDRKEEMRRTEESARIEREKFEKSLAEERRRHEEELKIRREEMQLESEKIAQRAIEQQAFQLKLLDIFKNSKDNSIEQTGRIVESLTSAGLNSIKTANEAAGSIIDIARRAEPQKSEEKKEGGGLGDILKEVGSIAGPLLAPYAAADAKLGLLRAAAGMAGRGASRPALTAQTAQAAQAAQAASVSARVPSASKEETGMIAQYLQRFPILRHALIGNIKQNLGPAKFLGIIEGIGEASSLLESLIVNLETHVLMDEIKQACTIEEQKLIDANPEWFKKLQGVINEELDSEEEGEGEAEEGGAGGSGSPAAPSQPASIA